MTGSQRLAFKPHFSPQILGDDRVVLLSEAGPRYLLRGKAYVQIAGLMDGMRTIDQIVEALPAGIALETAHLALKTLVEKGYAEEHCAALSHEQAAFWSGLGLAPATAAERLAKSMVAVIALGNVGEDARALSAGLASLKIVEVTSDEATLTVVVVEDYLQAGLAELNRTMHAAGRRWVMVKPVGQVPWFGPFFDPSDGSGDRPCWSCMARRLRCHRTAEAAVEAFNGGHHPFVSVGALPCTRSMAIQMAVTEIATWIARQSSATLDDIRTFDLQKMQMLTHRVMRQDECDVCGRTSEGIDPAIVLQSVPKRFKGDGGDRASSPEETWARLSRLVSPITGLAPDLIQADTDGGMPVYYVKQITPPGTAMELGTIGFATGKGETDLQARISCLGEAVERYSLGFRGNEPMVRARIAELGSKAVHPMELQHFSVGQHAGRTEWNARNPGFHWVPVPFDESAEADWSPNWSLTHDEVRWLPTSFCYFIVPPADWTFFIQSDANGCAAGNTREEAILQGFLELVERDSTALFWYNRAKRPSVRLASFHDAYFDRMVTAYAGKGRTLEVLDLTSELGITVVVAVSAKADGTEILLGLGCHLNPRTAVSRALSEMNQMEHQVQMWNRRKDTAPPPTGQQERDMTDWLRNATLQNQPYLVSSEASPREASDFKRLDGDDLLTDLQTCIEIVRENDMDLIVMDMTRTDVGFPVVRVTVPGLRHFWKRLGPGRLYETPVQLGWIPKALDEDELNPIPCFL